MATIHHVARAADVSIATVSRVLNGSTRVSEETRERVRAAAAELDYGPNSAARSLTTQTANAIGVLLPDLYGEFFSEVIRGIDNAARSEKYQVLISSSHADTDAVLAVTRSMRGRIDGLVVMAPDEGTSDAIDQITRRFPVVLLNPRFEVQGCRTVSIANFEGACEAVRHLLGLGLRDIVIMRGPAGNADAEARFRGYRAALEDAGVPQPEASEFVGDFTEASGFRAASEILGRSRRPDAVFAANDSMAIGLLSAFAQRGVRVPEDIALVGFDDITIARYLSPPLTTVHIDAYALGERAVHQLIQLKRSPEVPVAPEILPARLVVRKSCGSPSPRSFDGSHTTSENVAPSGPPGSTSRIAGDPQP
jgi:LacI family transcriptional regulator